MVVVEMQIIAPAELQLTTIITLGESLFAGQDSFPIWKFYAFYRAIFMYLG